MYLTEKNVNILIAKVMPHLFFPSCTHVPKSPLVFEQYIFDLSLVVLLHQDANLVCLD